MKIIGAIYVYNGKLVSIYKGDLTQVSSYMEAPVHFAKYLKKEGIEEVYFIDLNASISGETVNQDLLKEVIALGLKVIYGGGVRDIKMVENLFAMGVAQVVIGVSALEIATEATTKFGTDKILLGFKTKYDQLVSDKFENKDALDFAESTLAKSPAEYILFTDVLSSGVMIHPNYDMMEKISLLSGKKIYLAGGVSQLKHITILKRNKANAAIIGKAFYERKLSIKSALREANE